MYPDSFHRMRTDGKLSQLANTVQIMASDSYHVSNYFHDRARWNMDILLIDTAKN